MPSETGPSRAWVDVDLGALVRNAAALARHARVPLLPMVKADAYGVGAVRVARALCGADWIDIAAFGVATIAEGEALREAGLDRPIVCFTPLLPRELPAARAALVTPTLGDAASIAAWHAAGGGEWHLAIDTGMQRAGIRWDQVGALADALRLAPPTGAFTHFHSAEVADGSRELQEQRFREALAALPARPAVLHTENSGAIVRRSPSEWSLVRPGVFLYGVGSGTSAMLQPEPVAHLRAGVVDVRDVAVGESVSYGGTWRAVRPSRVATLACGYADGYRRSLGNRGTVLLGGARVPVVGTVTMDMTMVDVTAHPCALGDVATLLGRDGDQVLTAEAVGEACGLSPYEILTGLAQRAPHRYA
jgi:alanine racemase